MLVAFLIMLREGLEAALIVGIVASYLHQTGRRRWLPAVWGGAGLAAALCLGLGIALNAATGELPQRQQELFEGSVALIAMALLTSMVFWMRKAARSIKAQLQGAVEAALRQSRDGMAKDGMAKDGMGRDGVARDGGGWALVLMVFLAVGREGLESVFFLLATFQQGIGIAVPLGALLGLAGAVAVGAALYHGGIRLDLRRFFRVTGVFIILVAAGLLAGAVRAFHEAGLWNGLQGVVFDLSRVLPTDSPLGAVLAGLLGYNDTPTLGEALAYLLYLLPALALFSLGPPRANGVRTI